MKEVKYKNGDFVVYNKSIFVLEGFIDKDFVSLRSPYVPKVLRAPVKDINLFFLQEGYFAVPEGTLRKNNILANFERFQTATIVIR